MCEDNQTEVDEFFLIGFQNLHTFKTLLFIVFFLCYIVILNGNFIIIVLISINDHLKVPMFYFLKHLAIADLILTNTIIPMMLEIILKDGITISVTACIFQMHWFGNCGVVQCLLIAIMSYDRYLAICNPLHYHSIMQPRVCLLMVVWSWLLLVVFGSGEFILVYQLHFCDGKNIDHFFCDSGSVIELSNSDISLFVMVDLSLSIIVVFIPFAFIIVTYVFISFTILHLSSTNGRQKAFSTCSSHLATVCTYYGSLMAIYLTPADKRSPNTNKCMSLFYIVTTPLLNPIIYSLRNHEIRNSIKKMFRNVKTLNLH